MPADPQKPSPEMSTPRTPESETTGSGVSPSEAPKGVPPSVAGLILNYNGRDVTLLTLESMVEVDYPKFDPVVIDNGSTDDSFEVIRERHPQVRQLRVRENRGISWGLNHGIQWALEQGYDYLLLMNNDIEVAADMVTEMVRLAETDPRIGCIAPKAFYHGDRERLWSTGGQIHFRHSITDERGDGEIDRGQYERDEEVPYVNGCAMLVRAEAARAAGFWDPNYYLGLEDADYCMRVKEQGFTCWYAHEARLWHMISASIGVYKPTRTFHTGRSGAVFLRRHANLAQKLQSLLWFAAAMPFAFLRELPKRNARAVVQKVRGFWAGWRCTLEPIPTEYDDLLPGHEPTEAPPPAAERHEDAASS